MLTEDDFKKISELDKELDNFPSKDVEPLRSTRLSIEIRHSNLKYDNYIQGLEDKYSELYEKLKNPNLPKEEREELEKRIGEVRKELCLLTL